MSALDGTITITHEEYRPCLAKGKKALFHRWFETCYSYDKTPRILAIVEYEDGTVDEINTRLLKFLDSDELFLENELYFQEVESENKSKACISRSILPFNHTILERINENDILALDELVQIGREPLCLIWKNEKMYVRFVEIVDDMASFETFGNEMPMIMSVSTYGKRWAVRRVEKG